MLDCVAVSVKCLSDYCSACVPDNSGSCPVVQFWLAHKCVKQFSNGWEDRTSEVSPLNNHAMIHVLKYLSIIEQIKDRIEAVSLNFLQIFYVYSILHLFPSFNYSLYQEGLCQLFIINCPWRCGRKPLLSYLEDQNNFQSWKQLNNQMWGFIPSFHKWKDCSGSYCIVWSHHHWSSCWNPKLSLNGIQSSSWMLQKHLLLIGSPGTTLLTYPSI